MLPEQHKQTGYSTLQSARWKSDAELLGGCRHGDQAAWEQVMEKYRRLIYSIPLNCGLDSDESADIFQQTFVSLLDNLDRLRPDSNLGAWLATVARRHALHRLRKRKREQPGADGDLGDGDEWKTADAHDGFADFEQIQMIDQGLDQLGPRCRELLLALYFDTRQPSYEEIAERMRVAVGSIGPMRGRCLEQLREILSQE